jgi:hypothetical protein
MEVIEGGDGGGEESGEGGRDGCGGGDGASWSELERDGVDKEVEVDVEAVVMEVQLKFPNLLNLMNQLKLPNLRTS